MSILLRNVSRGFGYILKHEVKPGDALDLEQVFKGFCKPKKVSRDSQVEYIEFKPDEFTRFYEWVIRDLAADKSVWKVEVEGQEPGDAGIGTLVALAPDSKKDRKRKSTIESRNKEKRVTKSDLTPKDIAWLKPTELNKDIINSYNNVKNLKFALKLVRNLAGQEKIRKWVEERLSELAADGAA